MYYAYLSASLGVGLRRRLGGGVGIDAAEGVAAPARCRPRNGSPVRGWGGRERGGAVGGRGGHLGVVGGELVGGVVGRECDGGGVGVVSVPVTYIICLVDRYVGRDILREA